MSARIDRLCDHLRIKLHGIDRRLEALKPNGSSVSEKSARLAEVQIEVVQQRIQGRNSILATATRTINDWHCLASATRADERAAMIDKGDVFPLNDRADASEDYAVAVFEVAIAAADAAVEAALHALLARTDADRASMPSLTTSTIIGLTTCPTVS
jgi:hypothetical protein